MYVFLYVCSCAHMWFLIVVCLLVLEIELRTLYFASMCLYNLAISLALYVTFCLCALALALVISGCLVIEQGEIYEGLRT